MVKNIELTLLYVTFQVSCGLIPSPVESGSGTGVRLATTTCCHNLIHNLSNLMLRSRVNAEFLPGGVLHDHAVL